MPYNIFAECQGSRIVTRRVQPQRAVRQARDYRRRGYTEISIVDVDTGEMYDAASLAETLPLPSPPPG